MTVIDGSCHKYHFCRDKHVFAATKLCLPRQNLCRDKIMFLATNTCLFCRDKIMFGVTNMFVATSILLSRRKTCLSRQKVYLWQLPQMIHDITVLCLYEIMIIIIIGVISNTSSSSSSHSRSCCICSNSGSLSSSLLLLFY